jgi:gliding motility-associated-like protein
LEYSTNGTTYQSGTSFPGLAPGNYAVTVRNTTNGCTSSATNLTVNVLPTLPVAPTASVTIQPTCTAPTGTIQITAPLGANLEYSINGTTYQSGAGFPGLAPGNYAVTVRNITNGCTGSATNLTVNALSTAPAAPAASVTIQPTCTTPTGTIQITAPLAANLEYSINGTTYQSGAGFPGLAPGNYAVTVRNTTTGCISSATNLTVNVLPTLPVAPTASVTIQPTCTTPTGTIQITAPLAANLEYSIDGITYQSWTSFSGLAPGNYPVTVRNTTTVCNSSTTNLTVNVLPTAPAAPTASVTLQPTCIAPTGTIQITAPLAANLEYSINGTTYQSGTVFAGLAPGNYAVMVRNNSTTCVSTTTTLTINAIPTPPVAPSLTAVQPTCTNILGNIIVTAPLGTAFSYSADGTNFQTAPIFLNLSPGLYSIKVRDVNTGCISTASAVTINAAPTLLTPPVVSVIQQPNCSIPTGTVRVISPLGIAFEYSINGIDFQSSSLFSNVGTGRYNIRVRNNVTGCSAASLPVVINAVNYSTCSSVDIYFPSAFTPNGDGLNDGFGPGLNTVLGAVSDYTLQVYNRFGELIFRTNKPADKWNGLYKGAMLGNYSYTWIASYRIAGSNSRTKKGTVMLLR